MRKLKVFAPVNKGVPVALLRLSDGGVRVGCPKCGYGFLPFDKLIETSEKCPECNTMLDWTKVKFKSKVFY